MNPIKPLRRVFAFLSLALVAGLAQAETYRDIGDYVIHYNALPTDVLAPNIARSYDITRSKSRGMLNVAVLKKMAGTPGMPVTASVTAYSTNLNSQIREFDMREIREQNAIYYIGEFGISNQETLTFTITVSPEKTRPPQTLSFTRQFYVD